MPIFRGKGYTIFAILLLSRIKWSNHLSQTQNIWRSIINIHLVDWCPTVSLWLLVYLISSIKAFLILHRHLSLRRFHYWDLSLAIQQLCNRFPKIQFSLDKWKTLKNFTFLLFTHNYFNLISRNMCRVEENFTKQQAASMNRQEITIKLNDFFLRFRKWKNNWD